jgi:hypothetical protein
MFIGPFEKPIPWSDEGLIGSRRFLERVWRLAERVDKKDISVSGNIQVSNNVLVSKNISIGAPNDFISFGYTPATANTPSIFNIFPPSSGPTNPVNPGGPSSPDPSPNLACVLGLNYLASFPNAISIKQNLNNLVTGTGGNLVLGHTGAKAFIESQGGGSGPINHQGDLFVNQTCNRNVLFFGQNAVGFGNNLTNAMSVGGKLNVTQNMQIGIPSATNFLETTSMLFVQADAGSQSNCIKIKHANNGTFGIKLIELNDTEKAFTVFKAPSMVNDGAERFSVQGDGKTLITTTNADALQIADAANSNKINYKIFNDGRIKCRPDATPIATSPESALNPIAYILNDNTNSQNVYRAGLVVECRGQFANATGNYNNTGILITSDNYAAASLDVYNTTSNLHTFRVNADGKTYIGGSTQILGATQIGTAYSTSTPYMLTVNGKVGAREIKVSIQNPWPDYVFNKNYKLQSLENLENYLIKNKHLPNIPSAKELNSEELGLDLADMQGKQMEKIEEIYLHLIELNKKINDLKKENVDLKEQLKNK